MSSRSIRAAFAIFGTMVSVVFFACSDSTAPITARMPGNYELTTVLDSFTYSYSCSLGDNGLVCLDTTVSAGASRLYGSFTVGDTVQGDWRTFQFPLTDIVLHDADCALSTTQCTEATSAWSAGSITMRRDSLQVFGQFLYPVPIYLSGKFEDGRIVGSVSWATYVGCCAVRRYDGTFVATRQP